MLCINYTSYQLQTSVISQVKLLFSSKRYRGQASYTRFVAILESQNQDFLVHLTLTVSQAFQLHRCEFTKLQNLKKRQKLECQPSMLVVLQTRKIKSAKFALTSPTTPQSRKKNFICRDLPFSISKAELFYLKRNNFPKVF